MKILGFPLVIIRTFKKSGNYFLFTRFFLFTLIFTPWLNKLYGGKLELIYDANFILEYSDD